MKCLLGWAKEDVTDSNSRKKQDYLQALEILHIHAIEIWFVQSQLFQTLEKSHGNVGLSTLAPRICNR